MKRDKAGGWEVSGEAVGAIQATNDGGLTSKVVQRNKTSTFKKHLGGKMTGFVDEFIEGGSPG